MVVPSLLGGDVIRLQGREIVHEKKRKEIKPGPKDCVVEVMNAHHIAYEGII